MVGLPALQVAWGKGIHRTILHGVGLTTTDSAARTGVAVQDGTANVALRILEAVTGEDRFTLPVVAAKSALL